MKHQPARSGRIDRQRFLPPRERDVLELICEGLPDKKIAARLNLALNTIRNHVATVYSKLGAQPQRSHRLGQRTGLFTGGLAAERQAACKCTIRTDANAFIGSKVKCITWRCANAGFRPVRKPNGSNLRSASQ
ncbi:LuxR C-terminal-related transcriptional regulator [Serratia ureilytica]